MAEWVHQNKIQTARVYGPFSVIFAFNSILDVQEVLPTDA